MAELKKFLEREFLRLRSVQDNIQQQVNECLAHQRTSRDFQTEVKQDVAAIRNELAQLKRVPEKRIFPVGTMEALSEVRRKFRVPDLKEKLVEEIEYALERATKDSWLRSLITDEVVQEFREAKTIRQLNFINYVIRNITQTSDTAFTAMVSAAKSKLYSRRYRNKQKENRKGPAKKPRRNPEESEDEEDDDEEDEDEDEEEERKQEISSPAFSTLKGIR